MPTRKRPSGPTTPEPERRRRGKEQLKLRVRSGYRARLQAMAEAAGLTMSAQLEDLLDRAQGVEWRRKR